MDNWEELGDGIISKTPFIDNTLEILDNLILFVHGSEKVKGRSTRRVIKKLMKDENDAEKFKLMFALVNIDMIKETIFEVVRGGEDKIVNSMKIVTMECIKKLVQNQNFTKINSQKQDFFVRLLRDLINIITHEARQSAFKTYVKTIKDMDDEVDSYTVKFLSDRFNRDIYFVDPKTHLPYLPFPDEETLKMRKSILLLKIDETHYEIVGRLLPGNRIQREFDHNDPLITKFYLYLTNKDQFTREYPDVIQDAGPDPPEPEYGDPELGKIPKNYPGSPSDDEYYDDSSQDAETNSQSSGTDNSEHIIDE
jgi:hypothetical protein